MKRLFSGLLALSMSLSMVSNIVFASEFDNVTNPISCSKSEDCTLPNDHEGDCFIKNEINASEDSRLLESEVNQVDTLNSVVQNTLNNEIEPSITTPEQLLDLLASKRKTYGNTYTLANDITIDTSGLETSFSESYGSNIREFNGIFDGKGHTITVSANTEGKPSMPLFDRTKGSSSSSRAKIQNLNVKFEGNVKGSTIAGVISDTDFENIEIKVNGNILFADMMNNRAKIATGLFSYINGGMESEIKNIKITCNNIGEVDPQNAQYVIAAGLYTEINAAGGKIVVNGFEINANNIYAASSYNKQSYGVACAAGAVGGYQQSNLRIANTNVNVDGDISATTADGSSADADAYGLCYKTNAMYNCTVDVGGNITAKAAPNGYVASYNPYADITAAGMGYEIRTKYNLETFNATDTGISYVKVGKEIKAVSNGGTLAEGPSCVKAVGIGVEIDPIYTMKNVSVKANNILAEANDNRSAYAAGFAYIRGGKDKGTSEPYDLIQCTVEVNKISAISNQDGAYVAGFAYWCDLQIKDCSISAKELFAKGIESDASGFAYRFFPLSSYLTAEKSGSLDGCKVNVDSIIAENTNPTYTASVYGFAGHQKIEDGYGVQSGTIQNCEVTIHKELIYSSENKDSRQVLFAGNNESSYSILNNKVTIPKDQVEFVTVENDTGKFVRFTTGEKEGRARESFNAESIWESGNKLILSGTDNEIDVFCRYDDGDPIGTLWQINGDLDVEPQKQGGVKISKTVKGDKAPAESLNYEFKIYVLNADGEALSKEAAYTIERADKTTESGSFTISEDGYTFYLHHGENMTLSNLAEGDKVKIEEVTKGDFKTETKGLDQNGICEIVTDLTKEVEFINDYGNKTPVEPDKEDLDKPAKPDKEEPDKPTKPDKDDPNNQPNAPVAKPNNPVEKPKDPVEKPKDPTNKPNKNETVHTANETHTKSWISLLLGSASILAAIVMFNSKRKQV